MRPTTLGSILLLGGLVACEAPPPEPFESDVFWIDFTETSEACGPAVITENLTEARPTTSSTVTTGMASTPGHYLAVTLGEEGTAFVNFRGEVLLGEVQNDGSIEAMFTNTQRLDETRTSETYTHTRIEEQTVEQMLVLNPNNNEENPEFSGTFTRRDFLLLDLSENDEWDADLVGTGTSQMQETREFLDWDFQGEVINQEDVDDCQEDVCTLRVEDDCTRAFDVVAAKIEGATFEDFEVLDQFSQPEGVE